MMNGKLIDALRVLNGDNISDKSIRDAIFEAESSIDMGGGVFRASEDSLAKRMSDVIQEANELVSILTSIIKATKANRE
jgi:hypothetical protein